LENNGFAIGTMFDDTCSNCVDGTTSWGKRLPRDKMVPGILDPEIIEDTAKL